MLDDTRNSSIIIPYGCVVIYDDEEYIFSALKDQKIDGALKKEEERTKRKAILLAETGISYGESIMKIKIKWRRKKKRRW